MWRERRGSSLAVADPKVGASVAELRAGAARRTGRQPGSRGFSSARSFDQMRVGPQALRVEVCPVRPDHGPQLRIDASLPEQGLLAQGLEDLPPKLLGEIDFSHGPITES